MSLELLSLSSVDEHMQRNLVVIILYDFQNTMRINVLVKKQDVKPMIYTLILLCFFFYLIRIDSSRYSVLVRTFSFRSRSGTYIVHCMYFLYSLVIILTIILMSSKCDHK